MNKTDLLLQMMEQPHRYTADEWQEILADDECRELYTLMSKTQSAIDGARAYEEVTDETIDAEWQRFISEKQEVKSEKYSFLKIAAMFVGVLMLSGIAYAAIHVVSHVGGGYVHYHCLHEQGKETEEHQQKTAPNIDMNNWHNEGATVIGAMQTAAV